MVVTTIELLDWAIDATALLISLYIAKRVLSLTRKETLLLVASTLFYALHELWESGVIGGNTHRQFELWLHGILF